MQSPNLQKAAQLIQAGGVVCYPTEAVMGLGCDPFNQAAVARLLSLKQRPIDKGLILIAADWEQLSPLLASLTPSQQQQMQDSWPAAITWLVPCNDKVPTWIKGNFDSVAVRIPGHEQARALCQAVGRPIVSTSANITGQPSVCSAEQLSSEISLGSDFILPGKVGEHATPSQIIDLVSGNVFRS